MSTDVPEPPKAQSEPAKPSAPLEFDWLWMVFGVPYERFRRFAEIAVLASAALYGLGYVVALIYYQQVGVPSSALTPPRIVGAGLLYAILTELPTAEGFYLAHKRMPIIRSLIWLLTPPLFIHSWLGSAGTRSALPAIAYWLVLSTLGWAVSAWRRRRAARPSTTPDGDDSPFSRFVQPIGARLFAAASFATLISPTLPQAFGGGQPRAIEIQWKAPESLPPVLEAFKPPGAVPACVERCARLFELASDDKFLYLRIIEKDSQPGVDCTSVIVSRFWDFGTFPGTTERFVAVPKDEVRVLTYPR